MKQEFKAHPLTIISLMRPFFFILLIPVARGVLQYFKDGKITPILGREIIIFLILILYGILRWRAFSLVCDEKTVTVKDGLIWVREAVIPINGLSSVQSEQSPLDYIFKCVTFRINTEAGSREKTDYSFKTSRKNAHIISDLLYGNIKVEPVRFSPFKIALLAAATSSAFTGMLVGVPLINNGAKLVGVGVEELYDEIASVSGKIQTYFPPIVNTVTLILLISFIISFIYSFLRYLYFRVYLDDERIEVRSGFFVKIRTSFKKCSINNVKIEQTFLMRVLRRYAMKVNVGGFGEAKSESQVLVPSGRYKEIKAMFSDYFPFLKPDGEPVKSFTGVVHENRYFFWSELFYGMLFAAAIYFGVVFEEFSRFIIFAAFTIGCVLAYYTYLCYREYKSCMVRFGNTVFARGKKGLRSCRIYAPMERVGHIKLICFPPDKIFKTCNVKITIRSETADNVTVRHLDYQKVRKEILKCYDIVE